MYALANGALFSVDKTGENVTEWNKSNGLNGSNISHIAYDNRTKRLILCYKDGRIDLLDEDGSVTAMLDLFHKASTLSVTINSVFTDNGKAYLAMTFGLVGLDLEKAEVADTYHIGKNAESVDVQSITILGDSIYAASEANLYVASCKANLADYEYWKEQSLPNSTDELRQICNTYNQLYIL